MPVISTRGLAIDTFQFHMPTIDDDLASMFEIHRDAMPDHRLHLAHAPVRLRRMTHQVTGFQKDRHINSPTKFKDTPL